jgi:hypothetical protein
MFLVFTSSAKSQKITYGEGILMEHISSQTATSFIDLPTLEISKERNMDVLNMENQSVAVNEKCPFLNRMMESGNHESVGIQAGTILIMIEY